MDLREYKIPKSNPYLHTKSQSLGDEIFRFFNKRLAFPRIMRLIKIRGEQKVYEVFNEVRKFEAKNPVGLFIYKLK